MMRGVYSAALCSPLSMARPRGRPNKTPARARRASNAKRDDGALHAAGHGPYAVPPHVGTVLVIEESMPLLAAAAESLVAAGLALMRAKTVDQAVSFVRNFEIDGIVVCVGGSPAESWLRSGLDVLAQLRLTQVRAVAVVVRGALTVAERRVVARHRAEVVPATSLRHVAARDHLTRFLLPTVSTASSGEDRLVGPVPLDDLT